MGAIMGKLERTKTNISETPSPNSQMSKDVAI